MKKTIVKLAVIAALCLPAAAQTTQTWVTVIPASQQAMTLSVALPAGATYRFLSLNGLATKPTTLTAAKTVSDWDDGLNGRDPDPDPGTAKSLQVLQMSTTLSLSLFDSSVKPMKTTPVPVPALSVTYLITVTATGTPNPDPLNPAMIITNVVFTAVKK
jgi:hypothetical protein